MVGWEEIMEGGLADNAIVMSWRSEKWGMDAAGAGHQVVMTPLSHVYFNFYQLEPMAEQPLAFKGFTPLEKVYQYEPVPAELPSAAAQYVLGSQGQLWTEYIATGQQLDYQAFPRLCALAEVLWSGREQRNYGDFCDRLQTHQRLFKRLGINACLKL